MPSSSQGNDIRPGLIDLLNNVQSMTLNRMKPDRLELHAPQQIQRVAGLRGNPGVDLHGGIPDLAQVAINVLDVPNHHAARAVFHIYGLIC